LRNSCGYIILPFDQLLRNAQWVSEEMALKKCAALLFGAAGVLPSQSKISEIKLDAESLDYVAPLQYLWDQMSHRLEIKPMKHHEWQFFRLRPQKLPNPHRGPKIFASLEILK